MDVYIFGNPDVKEDNPALKAAVKLRNKITGINFKIIPPNADLLPGKGNITIMDSALYIRGITLFTQEDLEKIQLPPRNTVHDFDLGFQLHYLKKLGKLKNFRVIALPAGKKINYLRLQSIFRKLVAQDMQGS